MVGLGVPAEEGGRFRRLGEASEKTGEVQEWPKSCRTYGAWFRARCLAFGGENLSAQRFESRTSGWWGKYRI